MSEDDEEIAPPEEDDDVIMPPLGDDDDDDDEEHQKSDLEHEREDHEELEAARRERMELLEAELRRKREEDMPVLTGGVTVASPPTAAAAFDKFQFLVGQSEVFAHFLAGSVATSDAKSKRGRGLSRGKSNRMTEAEEDAALLKTAESARRTVYLNSQPKLLSEACTMHKYQLEGLNWMIKLHDHGINGILADEMGLGKTLQTISLLAYLREARGVKGPHIVVVPKSVVGNWIKEFRRWCPSIRAVRMGGTMEERAKARGEFMKPDPNTGKYKFDALVCSYEAVLKEKTSLGRIPWKYLIIDEAHRIKNENSSLSKAVRLLSTGFRLLITGTPLQNNLHELWALLNFLLPEIFGDSEQFDEWFSMSGKEGQENVIRKLHTVLRPFMLRRVKRDVACSLPPKKETKLFVGLTDMQRDWYKRILRKDAHELNALGGPSHARLQNVLMHLRKVCNHPYLFDGAEAGPPFSDGPHIWENSGKMSLLNKLLPKLKAKGSRVLIFCQMTRVLDILEDYLRLVGYEYCRIDGNTDGESRDSQMEVFNEPGSSKFCFLLSTRAGGLGINLATADIVILYDR
jgi:SWI/SNF-related matrix-associated actin-dependent regulator of chromatin subfamily A member 5